MKTMKIIRQFAGFTASIALVFGCAGTALASTKVITDPDNGVVTGIKNLNIGGKKYDVEFAQGSFNDVFGNEGDLSELENETPMFWDDNEGGTMAAQAIAKALSDIDPTSALVNSISVPYGENTTKIDSNQVWAKFSESKAPTTQLENDFSSLDNTNSNRGGKQSDVEFPRDDDENAFGNERDETPILGDSETGAMEEPKAIATTSDQSDGTRDSNDSSIPDVEQTEEQSSQDLENTETANVETASDVSVTLASLSAHQLSSSSVAVPEPTSTVALFVLAGTGFLATRKCKKGK